MFERPWGDGGTISYGAKVRAYRRYEKVTFGTNKEGWNRTRAELETEKVLQQIERGTWVPPRLEPRADRLDEAIAWAQRAAQRWRFHKVEICREFVMGTAGLEPATSRV